MDSWREMPYSARHDCPACHGAGFLHPVRADGWRPDYGRRISCECLRESIRAWIAAGRPAAVKREAPHVPGERRATGQTFASWVARQELAEALMACREFAAGHGLLWLVLVGAPGVGKSHLAQAVCAEVRARGDDAAFWSLPDWLAALKAEMSPAAADQERPPGIMEATRSAPWLVLDQAADARTPWEIQQLEAVLDWRYSEEARPTLLVADGPVESWPSERVRSRVRDAGLCRVVSIKAGDYRPRR